MKRRRLPWVLWGVAMLLLVGTVLLSALNGSFGTDAWFIPLAVTMILGYSTVGALLASRNPRNPIGWLMMTIGGAFVLGGFCDEYVTYTYVTNAGSLGGGLLAAWVLNWIYAVMLACLPLIGLLFPSGRVPGPRWRWLVPADIALGVAAVVGAVLTPGLVPDAAVPILNPTGVRGFPGDFLGTIVWLSIFALILVSIAAVVVRYRRSVGEERQQIRWLAYVAITAAAIGLGGLAAALIGGESFGSTIGAQLIFLLAFALVGIGVPAAMGIAVLRYRLYELDVVIKKAVVFAILVVLLMAAGGIVLVLPGTLVGLPSDEPGLILLAGVVLGLVLIPLYRLAARIADRVVYGGRAKPYEVLTEFSGRLADTYASEDVLPRTAAILGQGTGAGRVTIWLLVGGESVAAATWPSEDAAPAPAPAPAPGPDSFEVRHQGELLGSITVTMPANDPMNPAKERLIRDLASQAGLVLRNVRLFEEVRASRRRLVAAQDEERRRLERNIHDGAQQQLVALAVKLRLADQTMDRDLTKAHELLAQLQAETHDALETLRDLARGIYPPLLADRGLAAAIEAQVRKTDLPISLQPDGVGRYTPEIEATVYFCVLEAVQNVAKYANPSAVTIRLQHGDGELEFEVRDDGVGFEPDGATTAGSGLQGMADRLDAVGGMLEIASALGEGTRITGRLPVG